MQELKRYISDDGRCEGTAKEVEAYEANLNPLAKFKFPVRPTYSPVNGGYIWQRADGSHIYMTESLAQTGFALLNLMPLVEDLRQGFDKYFPGWRTKSFAGRWVRSVQALLLTYEKALGIEVPS